MKREKKIASVFTRSGNIMVCRSRDSAPFRVADPEAVSQLSGSGAPRRPEQGRAQAGSGGGRPDGSAARGEVQRRAQVEEGTARPGSSGGGGEERADCSADAPVSLSQRGGEPQGH